MSGSSGMICYVSGRFAGGSVRERSKTPREPFGHVRAIVRSDVVVAERACRVERQSCELRRARSDLAIMQPGASGALEERFVRRAGDFDRHTCTRTVINESTHED